MKKSKLLKNSTINKLIMGLSLMGILSAVSCDNESGNKPNLKGVNLSARQTDEGVKKVIQTGTAYVKLTMTTDQAGSTYAKYYKSTQDNGFDLKEVKFLIQTDGSIDEFFLKASESGITYWIQKFDIYDKDPDATGKDKGTLQYTISKAVELTLETEGSDNNVTIDVVKNGSEEKGDSTSLTAPSFSTKTVKGYSFIAGFLNASQLWFTKSNDYTIVFKVKHGADFDAAKAVADDNADYINEDIFKDAKDGDNLMEITLSKSLDYYKNQVFVVDASVKKVASGSIKHTFDISGGKADTKIRAGEIHLKIKNNFPTIKVMGGDGTHAYSDNNKTFNLGNVNNIKIFDPSDTDSDPLTNTYKWILYKDGVEVTRAGTWIHPSTTPSTFKKLSLYTFPSIRPAGVMISQNTTLASQTDIDSYTLKGYAKADDGLGGIIKKTVEFNFTKN